MNLRMSNFTENPFSGSRTVHVDRRTNKQADTTELTAAFRHFTTAPQNRVAGKIKYQHPEELVNALSLLLSLSPPPTSFITAGKRILKYPRATDYDRCNYHPVAIIPSNPITGLSGG